MTKWIIERDIIKVGDRVITPEGPGFVVSEIMGLKFTVRIDVKPKGCNTDTFEFRRREIITFEESERRMDAERGAA